jgi:hypothetical protein
VPTFAGDGSKLFRFFKFQLRGWSYLGTERNFIVTTLVHRWKEEREPLTRQCFSIFGDYRSLPTASARLKFVRSLHDIVCAAHVAAFPRKGDPELWWRDYWMPGLKWDPLADGDIFAAPPATSAAAAPTASVVASAAAPAASAAAPAVAAAVAVAKH